MLEAVEKAEFSMVIWKTGLYSEIFEGTGKCKKRCIGQDSMVEVERNTSRSTATGSGIWNRLVVAVSWTLDVTVWK
jgi:hypothetical protein